jgi:hypothetical protein
MARLREALIFERADVRNTANIGECALRRPRSAEALNQRRVGERGKKPVTSLRQSQNDAGADGFGVQAAAEGGKVAVAELSHAPVDPRQDSEINPS